MTKSNGSHPKLEWEYFIGNRGLENSELNTDARDSLSTLLIYNNNGQLRHCAPKGGQPSERSEAKGDKVIESTEKVLQ